MPWGRRRSLTTQPTAAGTWDEDPDGASIVLATGRARHDLLIVADPIYLTKIDAAWGRPCLLYTSDAADEL